MENISRKSSLKHLRFMANNRSGKRWLVDWPREYCKPWLHSIVTSPSSSCSNHLDSRAPANSPAAPGASLWSCQWGDPGLRESHCRGGTCPGRWVAVFQLWTPATCSCLVSADSWFVEQVLRVTASSSHSPGQFSKTKFAMSPALSLGLNKYSLVFPLTRINRKFI